MSKQTSINCCDSTVNPTVGCGGCELWDGVNRVCPGGLTTERLGSINMGLADSFEEVARKPGRVAKAAAQSDLCCRPQSRRSWLLDVPRTIFLGYLSDALSRGISFGYLKSEIIDVVQTERGKRHCWVWRTTRPKRMAQFSTWLAKKGITWPDNLWVGTLVTREASLRRIPHLLQVGNPSTLRFLWLVPQWEPIDLSPWLPKLDWVIQGGERIRCEMPFDLQWARDMLRQCREHSVPYFLERLGAEVTDGGETVTLKDRTGADWKQWPEDLCVREMPIRLGRISNHNIRQRELK